MERIYIRELEIVKVRHLENITVPVSGEKMKHLMLTGKNGSGKTSVMNALAFRLEELWMGQKTEEKESEDMFENPETGLFDADKNVQEISNRVIPEKNQVDPIQIIHENYTDREKMRMDTGRRLSEYARRLTGIKNGVGTVDCLMSQKPETIRKRMCDGMFIVAFYPAERVFRPKETKHIEKFQPEKNYRLTEHPGSEFVKFITDLRVTQAFSTVSGKEDRTEQIRGWFEKLEQLLQELFEDDTLHMSFDEETFRFRIHMKDREAFDFQKLSDGYSAILDIVTDLMIRMENYAGKKFQFDLPGIALIDEIETHLHLSLQRKIMPILTGLFPNIQFIVSTHSPFVLNSVENAVIYDLENHMLVKDGLADVSYEGIVESYFQADTLSEMMRQKYERFKRLTGKKTLTDEELEEISRLEFFLDEIPDYLSIGFMTDYQRRKLEFESREDL